MTLETAGKAEGIELLSYEVHIGHFFYIVNATVSFGNRLTLSIFRFQNFSLD